MDIGRLHAVTKRSALFGLVAFSLPSLTKAEASVVPGVYKGSGKIGRAALGDFTKWLGCRPSGIVDFLSYNTWNEFIFSTNWIASSWRGYEGRRTFTIPMLPADSLSSLDAGAKGQYDLYFKTIAQTLVSNGHASVILRIGHEFNGNWYPWSVRAAGGAWVDYWRRIVQTMRSVPESKFIFEWSPIWGPTNADPEPYWPGDDVVDIVGLSVYNDFIHISAESSDDRWKKRLTGPHGLEWHRDFAKAKGRKVSFPEWGTGVRPNGWGAGDDAVFILYMAEWLRQSDLSYHNYFDYNAKDYRCQLSSGPFTNAAAEFVRQFGCKPAV